jgi:hypothetical protein
MDPDEALWQLRSSITEYRNAAGQAQALGAADRVVDHADALDRWLTGGGFAPAAWRQNDQ